MFCSTPLLFAFLLNGGGLSYVFLAAAGLSLLSTLPVNVVMAQNLMPQSSSVVSSLMMGLAWGTGGMVVPVIGKIADVAGLAHALMAVSILPILGFILAQFLPSRYIE
jgi:FSR family fosmidomycin resistance protein-like MFS transporter